MITLPIEPYNPASGQTEPSGREYRGLFSQSSLIKLLKVLFKRLVEIKPDDPTLDTVEILLHLPVEMVGGLSPDAVYDQQIESNKLFLCRAEDEPTPSNRNTGRCIPVVDIPSDHFLYQEILMIMVSNTLTVYIAAAPDPEGSTATSQEKRWDSVVLFSTRAGSSGRTKSSCDEIVERCEKLQKSLKETLRSDTETQNSPMDAVLVWLTEAISKIQKQTQESSKSGSNGPIWEDFLTELMSVMERRTQDREKEVRQLQLINHVQDVVGWELDPNRMFSSIAEVLKRYIGFHYLELQLLESQMNEFKLRGTHQQNDTDFGGTLLNIILQQEYRDDVLHGRKPVSANEESAKKMLMNPLLLKYMKLKSAMIVPLFYGRRVNGIIKMFSQEENHYTPYILSLMEVIGNIISRSIENVQSHMLMKRMATIDGLTGIYNRRFLTEQLNREFKRAARYHEDLTMIMSDIDHFKHYNDTNGHLQGDQVLIGVAEVMRSSVREADIVARYGGEEFAVVLPETSLERGVFVCEKIQAAIAQYPFLYGDTQPLGQLSMSLGIATNTQNVQTIAELINRADIALYQAKRSGRNCFRVYDQSKSSQTAGAELL